jgi:hypothetical protein
VDTALGKLHPSAIPHSKHGLLVKELIPLTHIWWVPIRKPATAVAASALPHPQALLERSVERLLGQPKPIVLLVERHATSTKTELDERSDHAHKGSLLELQGWRYQTTDNPPNRHRRL